MGRGKAPPSARALREYQGAIVGVSA